MSWGDFFKDWGCHVFSIAGIIGGLFLYFRHDRKIKEQERKLNDFQLKKYQEEEDLKRQAKIECSIIPVNDHHEIRFYNSGQADARNVRIEILNKDFFDGIEEIPDWGPYRLIVASGGCMKEPLYLWEECGDELQLCINWDDDFGNNRSYNPTLQI